jgi:hypothetical protein
MGDEKYYTIQIKGTAYRFKPLSPVDIKKVVFISQMDPTGLKSFKVLSRVLSESAGMDQWGQILDRYLADELKETEFTSDIFAKLIKRQDKSVRDTGGLDVASTRLVPADDAE